MSVYDQSIYFFVDDIGVHFESTVPTRIECILNDPSFCLADGELKRAASLRRRLVGARLKKYNDEPFSIALPSKPGKRILLVEQARNDWAVLKSGGAYRTFQKMLKCALDENPDAQILVQVDPTRWTARGEG